MWAIRLYFCSVELKKTCLWQPCILNHTSFHFNSPRNWLITWIGKLVHLKGSRNQRCVRCGSYPFGVNHMEVNFSIVRETLRFFSILHSRFFENLLSSNVELNSGFLSFISNTFHTDYGTSVGYTTQPSHALWFIRKPLLLAANKSRAWESRVGEHRFRVSLGWAGTQCAFQVGKSIHFKIAGQGGAIGAEEQSWRLINT